MRKVLLILALVVGFLTSSAQQEISIIPQPMQMSVDSVDSGVEFALPLTIAHPKGDQEAARVAKYYAKMLGEKFAGKISVKAGAVGAEINIRSRERLTNKEAYNLSVNSENGIMIEVGGYAGGVYSLQSLLQLMPAEVYGYKSFSLENPIKIPAVEIVDVPRFGWRGMHLDCSRHFFEIDSIYRYIDYLVMNKMNRFHWHLVDDQGWRMESKKYPLLNEKSAWRINRLEDSWDDRKPIDRTKGEVPNYGGYYTQKEIRELVAYAKERAVMIIPEIELPGHTSEVFAAYPELSCLGHPQEVTPGGYYPEDMATCFCAGNEAAFEFLEGILTETMELFPDAEYIHIGGDEVDKRWWRKCPKCAKRMEEEGLKDMDELQSYFIARMEKFVNSKGRPIIGWDEILEGGLAPNATVMSWRGIAGGIAAAKAGHDVIMTPNSHLYFDYYQNTPAEEPKALGGFITTKRVYEYDPIPEALTPLEAKHILGVQANLWTEFVLTFSHVEYMTLPRMMAVAEVGWSPKEAKNWTDFARRLYTNAQRLQAMGANYHRGATVVDFETTHDTVAGKFLVSLDCEVHNAKIHYTTDGSVPTLQSTVYAEPIEIQETTLIKALISLDGKILGTIPTEKTIGYHKALGKKITYNHKPHRAFLGGNGDLTLVDGITGTQQHNDGFMQGFNNRDFDLTIDLGDTTEINSVVGSFFQSVGIWSYLPQSMEIRVSDDGENWELIGTVGHEIDPRQVQVARHSMEVVAPQGTKARFVNVRGINPPTAEGLAGAGTINWIFIDEIFVN